MFITREVTSPSAALNADEHLLRTQTKLPGENRSQCLLQAPSHYISKQHCALKMCEKVLFKFRFTNCHRAAPFLPMVFTKRFTKRFCCFLSFCHFQMCQAQSVLQSFRKMPDVFNIVPPMYEFFKLCLHVSKNPMKFYSLKLSI